MKKASISLCALVIIVMLLLTACGKKDAMLKGISEEINNETYRFSKIKNIDMLSECSSDPEVAGQLIQLITALSEENKIEGIEKLLKTFEEHNYSSPEVAECVANIFWSSNEGILRLIDDDRFERILRLDYYGPVSGVKKIGLSQMQNVTEQMTLMDKVELWKKMNDNFALANLRNMISFTEKEVSEYTTGMTLPEKLVFLEEIPDNLDMPNVITADDVNTYIEENEREIYTSSGLGGYYDNLWNRNFRARNRVIMQNGDIYTDTAIRYLGDFAVIETDIEYLNSTYEIQHRKEHTMYFRDTEIDIDGDIDTIKYAPPYLFSITKSKTEIFEVDNEYYARMLYTVQ